MAIDPDQGASTKRIATRALFLVVPLVLGAIAVQRVPAMIRSAMRSATASGTMKPTGSPADKEAEPAPRPPEAPSPEQIDKAFAASKALAESERGWKRVEVIAPGVPPAPGVETTAPFQGFGLSLESEPDGASVTVDGKAYGETPLLAGLRCQPGATLRIRLTRPPLPPRDVTTLCRADTLVKLRVRLGSN